MLLKHGDLATFTLTAASLCAYTGWRRRTTRSVGEAFYDGLDHSNSLEPVMKQRLTLLAVCLASASLLVACGGGSDEPQPSDADSLITVSSASVSGQNGFYGSTQVGLSDVEKVYDLSKTTCTYSFNNLTKFRDSSVSMSGKVAYLEGTNTLSRLEVTVNGAVYASGAVDDSRVERDNNRVVFKGKQLSSTAGDTNTLVVSGAVPMRGNRPSGC